MAKRAIHRVLELAIGIPVLLFGGGGIIADIRAYMWVQEDPEHRWGFVGVGTTIGLLPFLAGCWLVSMAVIRTWSRTAVNPPAPNPYTMPNSD
jgi:hypothetical protein